MWVDTCQALLPQLGMMRDYHTMPTCELWYARPGQTTVGQAQEWLYQACRGIWVSAQCLATDPDRIRIQRTIQGQHTVVLGTRAEQQLTALSLPVWAFMDGTQLAGLWYLLMTTYHTNGHWITPWRSSS